LGQARQHGELGGCNLWDGIRKYRKMPLRDPAQDIANLIIQNIRGRFDHGFW
jgi:hypothetical protein